MPATGALLLAAGGLLAAYLLGSVPFGYLIGRLRGVDVRAAGSGNIGATNVARLCGKGPAAAVLLLDAGKGLAAAGPLAWLILDLGSVPPESALRAVLPPLYALAVVAGHVWTAFLGFRGGRGVATAAGALTALAPLPVAIGLGAWALTLAVGRYISLASVAAALAVAAAAVGDAARRGALAREWPVWGLCLAVAALVVARHLPNMKRLARGQEPKLGARSKVKEPQC